MARSYHGTPLRSFRIPDELYAAAKDAAPRQGTTLAAVVVQALEALVERDRVHRAFVEGLEAEPCQLCGHSAGRHRADAPHRCGEPDCTCAGLPPRPLAEGAPRVPQGGKGGTARHTKAR